MIKTIGAVEPIEIKGIATPFLARVDTGAKTSSISADPYIVAGYLCFFLENNGERRLFYTSDWIKVIVKSANGKEIRYLIHLSTVFDGRRMNTSFTLTDRSSMKYKVLLGRSFLNNKFLVDCSKSETI